MAQLRNALRAYAYEGLGPAEALTAVTHLMERTAAPGFATCLYAVVDTKGRAMTWARAGHPPMGHHRADTTRFLEGVNGPPLGAFADIRYEQATTEIEPGDLIVMYTDGLIERRGESLDAGLQRLSEAIQTTSGLSTDSLCRAVCDHLIGAVPNSDDLCILAFRVPPDA